MARRPLPLARVGIVGGGQLGRMLVRAASRLACETVVLDPLPGAPAAEVATRQIVGAYDDAEKLRELVEQCDVTTFDLEDIGAEALVGIEKEGHRILPSPGVLMTIQDKLVQKDALADAGIPQVVYAKLEANEPQDFASFGYPLVQKARRGGYDGRGVAILRGPEDYEKHLPVDSYAERFVEAELELGVMVARGQDGHVVTWPVTEMVFREDANILSMLLAPARVSDDIAERARELAADTVRALEGVGVFGVELFLTRAGDLLVNEVSPRTHNSGHYTVEACLTNQFEQQLRAILGLPLGSTKQLRPAAMVNLLGEGDEGPAAVEGLDAVLAIEGASVHLYGKQRSRPSRKMGHVTVLGETLEDARKKAEQVARLLRVSGEDE